MKALLCLALLAFSPPARADADPFAAAPAPVLAFHQAVNGTKCQYGADYADNSIGAIASAYDIGSDWKLYLIPCGAGAYQSSFNAYVAKADNSDIQQLLVVKWMSDTGVYASASLSDATFEKGILRSYAVGRSIGDCGEADFYKLKVDKYSVQVIVNVIRAKENCDGKMNPWPVVFPKK